MSNTMLHFIDLDRQPPKAREAKERALDFGEIYQEYAAEKAAAQASRCSQCGVPFCQEHCPLGNNIPDWLRATAEGRLQEAYEISAATNSMPEICGRICPQDRLCEGSCVIEQSGHGTVTIGAVEKYLTETAWENGWVAPIEAGAASGQSVGIIGSGPGGLAAAEALIEAGHAVTVYDRHDRAGGLLTYGIPNFKLEKEVVERRLKRLEQAGVKFVLNCNVGKDVGFTELRARHDALLLATGVYKGKALSVPGAELGGVVRALDYLIASNRTGLGDDVPEFASGELNAAGKTVVVLGGGDTAMDCVRTAIRQGAKSVTCLYRRDRTNMPGSAREVKNAEEEGVTFTWLANPLEIKGKGVAKAVRAARMRLGASAPGERQRIEQVPGEDFDVPADMVITAFGFDPENLPKLFGEPALGVKRNGTVVIDPKTAMTSMPGVFAVGDIVRGASLVVWAIRDGREAARHIDTYLATARDEEMAEAS